MTRRFVSLPELKGAAYSAAQRAQGRNTFRTTTTPRRQCIYESRYSELSLEKLADGTLGWAYFCMFIWVNLLYIIRHVRISHVMKTLKKLRKQKVPFDYRLFFLRWIAQFFTQSYMNCFVRCSTWTNWANFGRFMDNCWISCQVMAGK